MKKEIIPSPTGFKAGGIHCGIKKRSKDIALIYSTAPACAAGMFTTNQVYAASVKITRDIISTGTLQAIIANSGNANALTGAQGERDALEMTRATANALEIDVAKVAVASTGSIGKPLPINKILEGIEKLSKKISPDSFGDAALAIMTTDTHPKMVSRQIELDAKKITITAIAKGAGMIYPNMATMLCFIATDLKITQPLLHEILRNSVDQSFNCISVDGCTSTNDTVLAMANGLALNSVIDKQGDDLNKVQEGFNEVTKELAKMIVSDGEGATKLIEIEVKGAESCNDARAIAFSIANYNLLKCSFFGETLNLGRLMAAIGASSIKINTRHINIYLGKILLLNNGEICQYQHTDVLALLKHRDIKIKVELGQNGHNIIVWTTDLSTRYVKINTD